MENIMAIGNAVQVGAWVHIYDDKGQQTSSVSAGSEPGDGLKGYTSSTVNVQNGAWVLTYDENGHHLNSTSIR